jgi:hypothetical protein
VENERDKRRMKSKYNLSAIIEALQIFQTYKDEDYPTCCEHDELMVLSVPPDDMSEEDRDRLDELGFEWVEEGFWRSYRFGSA